MHPQVPKLSPDPQTMNIRITDKEIRKTNQQALDTVRRINEMMRTREETVLLDTLTNDQLFFLQRKVSLEVKRRGPI